MSNQKDIILIPFPYSDLTGSKKRPALIISNNKLNKTSDRICCLITTKPAKEDILLDKFEKGSLPFKSFVRPHRIFTIEKNIIIKKLCTIDNQMHKKIIKKINEYIKEE